MGVQGLTDTDETPFAAEAPASWQRVLRRSAGLPLLLLIVPLGSRAALADAPSRAARDVLAHTSEGPVQGQAADGVVAWKGLPFAAPPLGPLRWQPPQPPAPRTGILEAAAFGPACPQTAANPLRQGEEGPRGEEDCLSVNIWAPAEGEGPWPVLVWIHGGGHVQGTAGDPIYDGSSLARDEGLVVASFNYRLGALGYLAAEALARSEGPLEVAGNYGLLDQVASLRWLRRNLPAFGGDPGRVAIAGESAGGVSVCALMASPLAAGLFQAAVMQSGSCLPERRLPALAPRWPGQPAAYEQGRRFSAALGCAGRGDEADCLRGQDVAKVLATLPGDVGVLNPGAETYGEVLDGWALPEGMAERVAYGRAQALPWIIGANADEATIFLTPSQKAMGYEAFALLVRQLYGGSAEAVLSLYPQSAYPTGGEALAAVTGDVAFVCPARRIAGWHAAAGRPTWLYHFTQVTEAARRLGLGAHHGAEIPFLFRMLESGPLPLRGPPAQLSEAIRSWWADLATVGAPRAAAAGPWPAYDAAGDWGMRLEAPPLLGPVAGWRGERCKLWDGIEADLLVPDGGPPAATPVPTDPAPSPARLYLPWSNLPG